MTAHLSGLSLRAELQSSGAFAPALAAEWFEQILVAVHAAHVRGIVHRHLQPENIIGVRDGSGRLSVRVVDFGFSVVGTWGYMAPEQMLGESVDLRCDVFAAGVMLVEMLTGKRPFDGATFQQVSQSVLNDDYHLPMTGPAARMLDVGLQCCLAKPPQDRWDSIGTVQRELEPCLQAYVTEASHTAIQTRIATTPPATQSIQ